jgi:hypothetical protein
MADPNCSTDARLNVHYEFCFLFEKRLPLSLWDEKKKLNTQVKCALRGWAWEYERNDFC